MLNEAQLAQVRTFFREFTCSPLYDTGFGETVLACGAHTAMSNADLVQCTTYIQGAADWACRSQPRGTPQWHIYHVMSVICGALRCCAYQVGYVDDSTLDNLLNTYRQKLTDLVREKLESRKENPQ